MKYALQLFNHNLNLACILNDAGIDEPNSIDVIDVEIVQPSNVERFKEWYCNRLNGKYKHDIYKMEMACEVVINHKINQNGSN